MPFAYVPTISRTTKASMASISYRKKETKNGRTREPRLIIGIPATIANGFKPANGTKFELHIGTGADAGKARITPGPNGVAAAVFIHGFVFRFGYVPALGDDQAAKESINAKMVGKDSFELELPAWFKTTG